MTIAALIFTVITAGAALWTVRLAYMSLKQAEDSARESKRAAQAGELSAVAGERAAVAAEASAGYVRRSMDIELAEARRQDLLRVAGEVDATRTLTMRAHQRTQQSWDLARRRLASTLEPFPDGLTAIRALVESQSVVGSDQLAMAAKEESRAALAEVDEQIAELRRSGGLHFGSTDGRSG